MSRNFLTVGAVAGAGAIGYYFYQAGGDTQKAQKNFKNDIATLQQKTKEEDKSAQNMGAKVDQELQRAKDQGKSIQQSLSSSASDAQKRLEDARKSTGNELMKGVDKFDKTVEDGASKAKSGISSWFGGK